MWTGVLKYGLYVGAGEVVVQVDQLLPVTCDRGFLNNNLAYYADCSVSVVWCGVIIILVFTPITSFYDHPASIETVVFVVSDLIEPYSVVGTRGNGGKILAPQKFQHR